MLSLDLPALKCPLALAVLTAVCSAQNVTSYENIPEPFLFLLREPAVQDELKLNQQQKSQLVELNHRYDGELLSSRNIPPDKAQEKTTAVLAASRQGASQLLDKSQQTRLRQITFRTRGIGFVLHPDAAQELQLTETQQNNIRAIVDRTATSISALQRKLQARSVTQQEAEQQATSLRKDEQLAVLAELTEEQKQELLTLIGPKFDLTQLGRVSFRAPELSDSGIWINSPPLQISELRGRVVALHFWAFGCINCIHNYEWYQGWQKAYADDGLVIIGVHTPETSREREVDLVREKVAEQGFQFPVVVDNDSKIWNAWGNSMWPSVYLIDKQGRLRYWWYGELNWQGAGGQEIMGKRIEELLAEGD